MAHDAALIFLCIFTVYGFVRLFADIIEFIRTARVRKMSSAVIKITSLPESEDDREYVLRYYEDTGERMGVGVEVEKLTLFRN